MKSCQVCGNPMEDDAQFCTNCGSAVPAAPAAQPVAEPASQPTKKKGKGKLIALIIVAVLVLAAAAVLYLGFTTNWFQGPMGAVRSALNKLESAKSYTIRTNYEYDSDNDDYDYSYSSKVTQVKDFAYIYKVDDTTGLTYKNKQYIYSKDYATIIDLEKEAEDEEEGEEPEVTYTVNDMILDVFMNNQISTEDMEALLKSLELGADADEVCSFLESVEKDCLRNQEWLEEYLNWEKEGNTYSFEVNVNGLHKELVNKAYDTDVISSADKKTLLETKLNIKFTFEMEIDKGYPTRMQYTIKASDYKVSYIFKYTDLNRTEITQDDVDKIIKKVEEIIAANYRDCEICKENMDKSAMWEIEGKFYCDECYGKMSYCYECNAFLLKEDMAYVGSIGYCAECYAEYKATHFATCPGCQTEGQKNTMFPAGDDYYCLSCYNERRQCDDCGDFLKYENLVMIHYNYLICQECYEHYKLDHTCDLCNAVVGLDYLCPYHDSYDKCQNCGRYDDLSYHVTKKQRLCYSCAH